MAGLETDSIEAVEPVLSPELKIVAIEHVEAHPNADRLALCRLRAGDQQWSVVCGAANVAADTRAVFAPPGSELPNGLKIEARRIRGVSSDGMLCSATELGLAEEGPEAGILLLEDDAPVGESFAGWLGLPDEVLSLDLTPNRGDCLSMLGVAREIAALNGSAPGRNSTEPEVVPSSERSLPVRLASPENCPIYHGQVIEGVDPTAVAPLWMRERLRRAGYRGGGHAVVDITNYVMLELGQPLHAFDLQQLSGEICVRRAEPGERLTVLQGSDGTVCTLDTADLLIADARGAVALAGVMGGRDSAVGAKTRDLFLEAAWFSPAAVAGRARHHKLNSEAARRFERGVDPTVTPRALQRAVALILQYVGGRAGPPVSERAAEQLPRQADIVLRRARVRDLLGIDEQSLPDTEIVAILQHLGMDCRAVEGGWQLRPPPWRFDIALEVDLLEELARMHGYDQLPEDIPKTDCRFPSQLPYRIHTTAIGERLAALGYRELIGYSMVAAADCQRFEPERQPVALENPLSTGMAVLRTGLWSGLVQSMADNSRRQSRDFRIFEVGNCFVAAGSERPREERLLGLLCCGSRTPENWDGGTEAVDFFDLKGDLQTLLDATGQTLRWVAEDPHPALHPGRSARILRVGDDRPIGVAGLLHPRLVAALKLPSVPALAQLQLSALVAAAPPQDLEPSNQPALSLDLGLVVAERLPAGEVQRALAAAIGEFLVQRQGMDTVTAAVCLERLFVFDCYSGKGIADGCKCLSFRMLLRDHRGALNEDVTGGIIDWAVQALNRHFPVSLRDADYSK